MKQVFDAGKILLACLLALNLWAASLVLAKNEADTPAVQGELDAELENEEAGLEEEDDVLADTLLDLEDDFDDVLQKIVQVAGKGSDVSSFQKSAREVETLLKQANNSLEKGNRIQTQRDMDEALAKLKSLNDKVSVLPGAEVEEEAISEEIETEEDEEDVKEVESASQEQKTEIIEKRNIVARIVSGLWGWIAGLFS